jgi:undecaprenyl-diphosphatase
VVATKVRKTAEQLNFVEGALVGGAQTLALLPGISRSGVTIVGGLLAGLSYEQASRFSFMLATPVIGLAALKEVPKLLHHHEVIKYTIPSALLAGITAYLSVRFLMKYFQHNRLAPFGYYCVAFGTLALVLLRMR